MALFGGGGIIGRQIVRALAAEGRTVRVIARRASADLATLPGVHVVEADAERPEDVDRGVRGARAVVDLVYPKDGEDEARRMVAGAELIARACLRHGVGRLVYTSSIEAIFLGDPRETVTGATPPDPRSAERDPYAHGKAEAERALASLSRAEGLDVTVLRPGIVVGRGCPAFHAGVGRFVNHRHCVSFGDGHGPLPFVLVDDVADAFRLALSAAPAGFRAYNLVGDARLTAREYVAELARVLDRPILFHRRDPTLHLAFSAGETALKRLAGRRDARAPSRRSIEHLQMRATFDCSDVKRDLGWAPAAGRAELIARAIAIHAPLTPWGAPAGRASPRHAAVHPAVAIDDAAS